MPSGQAREAPRKFVERESHYLWGRRHLLTIVYLETKPFVSLDHRRITITVRPGSDAQKRAEVIHEWHKSLLRDVVPPLIKKWELKLKVKVARYFLQRMKTKWGSCNHKAGHIRLNTQLVTKPKDPLEYVIVHEMVHLIEPTHSGRLLTILGGHYPTWREAPGELNELPLAPRPGSSDLLVPCLRRKGYTLSGGATSDVGSVNGDQTSLGDCKRPDRPCGGDPSQTE